LIRQSLSSCSSRL